MIGFRGVTPGSDWVFAAPEGRGAIVVHRAPILTTNNGDAALAHATAGGGITAAYCYQADAAIRAGELIELLAAYAPSPVPIHAVFPTTRLMPRKSRIFLDAVAAASAGWRFLQPQPRSA